MRVFHAAQWSYYLCILDYFRLDLLMEIMYFSIFASYLVIGSSYCLIRGNSSLFSKCSTRSTAWKLWSNGSYNHHYIKDCCEPLFSYELCLISPLFDCWLRHLSFCRVFSVRVLCKYYCILICFLVVSCILIVRELSGSLICASVHFWHRVEYLEDWIVVSGDRVILAQGSPMSLIRKT